VTTESEEQRRRRRRLELGLGPSKPVEAPTKEPPKSASIDEVLGGANQFTSPLNAQELKRRILSLPEKDRQEAIRRYETSPAQRGKPKPITFIPERLGQAFQTGIIEPAAGIATETVQKAIPGEQEVERRAREFREEGIGPFTAAAEAFRQSDFPSTTVDVLTPFLRAINPALGAIRDIAGRPAVPLPAGRSFRDVQVGVKGAIELAADPINLALGAGPAIRGLRGLAKGIPAATERLATRGIPELRPGSPRAPEEVGLARIPQGAPEPPSTVPTRAVEPPAGTFLESILRGFALNDRNLVLASKFKRENIQPAFLARFGDFPVMNFRQQPNGEPLLAIATAGWRKRAEEIGLEFVKKGAFEDLYRIPQAQLRPGVPRVAPEAGRVRVPPAVAGQPEAGVQAGALGVPDRVVTPRGKGITTQISMDDQLRLEQARQAEQQPALQSAFEQAASDLEGVTVRLEALRSDPVVRPRWSAGLTNEELKAVARQEGVSPYSLDWGDALDLEVISEAKRGAAGRSGYHNIP